MVWAVLLSRLLSHSVRCWSRWLWFSAFRSCEMWFFRLFVLLPDFVSTKYNTNTIFIGVRAMYALGYRTERMLIHLRSLRSRFRATINPECARICTSHPFFIGRHTIAAGVEKVVLGPFHAVHHVFLVCVCCLYLIFVVLALKWPDRSK